jgi:hypothetical protein
MRKITPFIIVIGCSFLAANAIHAAHLGSTESRFSFKDANGETESIPVISKYYPKKIQPRKLSGLATVDQSIDPKLMRAASIAEERAHAHSRSQCWHYVKAALLAAGAVKSYPKTVYAKEAGRELVSNYGFKKLSMRDPFKAPVGAVLVYGGSSVAGHVEIRTRDGFVSDFKSRIPSPRPLVGVYTKS